MAAAAAPAPAASQVADHLLTRQPPGFSFSFTPFLQRTYQHSLPADRPVCKMFASGSACPLKTRCTERHVPPEPIKNKDDQQQQQQQQQHQQQQQVAFGSLVCKHWLRGLCKKGDGCEFLHEYNLRRMPECNFFLRHGYCNNGEECLYLHIDPRSRVPACPWYDRGFCPLGPRCARKHVRRPAPCPYYLAGFCPLGRRACNDGSHPRWTRDKGLDPPRTKEEAQKAEAEAAAVAAAAAAEAGIGIGGTGEEDPVGVGAGTREEDGGRDGGGGGAYGGGWRERERDGHKYDRGGRGGRGGRWRGKGGGRFNHRGRDH